MQRRRRSTYRPPEFARALPFTIAATPLMDVRRDWPQPNWTQCQARTKQRRITLAPLGMTGATCLAIARPSFGLYTTPTASQEVQNFLRLCIFSNKSPYN